MDGYVCAGSCCTCCCCLHTIGGLIGASLSSKEQAGTSLTQPPPDQSGEQDRSPPATGPLVADPSGPSARDVFWWSTLVLIALGLLIGPFWLINEGAADGAFSSLVSASVIVLLVLPGLQLFAAFITLIILRARPERPTVLVELVRLGNIAAGTLFGALVGLGIMILFGVLLSLR